MLAAAQHSGSGAEAGAEGGDPLPLVSADHPCKILNMTLQQEHVLGPDLGQHRSAGSAGGAAFEHQPRLVQAETHPPQKMLAVLAVLKVFKVMKVLKLLKLLKLLTVLKILTLLL